jgi:hypothetical protein
MSSIPGPGIPVPEAVLAKLGHAMTELKIVLIRLRRSPSVISMPRRSPGAVIRTRTSSLPKRLLNDPPVAPSALG